MEYVDLKTLFSQSDVISLHCPLTPENYHLLNQSAFDQMKDGVMIINTSRGGLIDSQAAIEALKTQKLARWVWTCMRTNATCSLRINLTT